MIELPTRSSISEQVVRAASKCLRFACERAYDRIPVGSVATIVSGGTPDTHKVEYWDGDVVWVTPKDLGGPRTVEVLNSERTISREGLEHSSARLLPVGTVILNSRAPIGHVGISAVPLCTNQGFKNVICGPELHNRYLFHMLRASIEELQALGRGNTFLEIPSRAVQDLELPLPPIDVQAAVARFLDAEYDRQSGKSVELPDLPACLREQRRIVARIEELAARIKEARLLRREAVTEADQLLGATISAAFSAGEAAGWVYG